MQNLWNSIWLTAKCGSQTKNQLSVQYHLDASWSAYDDSVLDCSCPGGADSLCRTLAQLIVGSRSMCLRQRRIHLNFATSKKQGKSSLSHECPVGKSISQRLQGAQKLRRKWFRQVLEPSNWLPQNLFSSRAEYILHNTICHNVEISGYCSVKRLQFGLDFGLRRQAFTTPTGKKLPLTLSPTEQCPLERELKCAHVDGFALLSKYIGYARGGCGTYGMCVVIVIIRSNTLWLILWGLWNLPQ